MRCFSRTKKKRNEDGATVLTLPEPVWSNMVPGESCSYEVNGEGPLRAPTISFDAVFCESLRAVAATPHSAPCDQYGTSVLPLTCQTTDWEAFDPIEAVRHAQWGKGWISQRIRCRQKVQGHVCDGILDSQAETPTKSTKPGTVDLPPEMQFHSGGLTPLGHARPRVVVLEAQFYGAAIASRLKTRRKKEDCDSLRYKVRLSTRLSLYLVPS